MHNTFIFQCILLFFITFSHLFGLTKVYFTPRDDIKSELIQLINEEKVSICGAVYMLTDKTIAQALIQAHVRGVKVCLVLDQISMGEKYGKGLLLGSQGIQIVVHPGVIVRFMFAPIMHHKFFIFGFNSRLLKPLVWTGSFNCTASAARIHDENVVLLDDVGAIQEFKQCFAQLIQRFGHKNMLFDFTVAA